MTFRDAEANCKSDGAMLAVEMGSASRGHINSFPENFWCYGNDTSKNTGRNCTYIDNGKHMIDDNCNNMRPSLCQIKGALGCGVGQKCPTPLLYPYGRQADDHVVP